VCSEIQMIWGVCWCWLWYSWYFW